MANKRRTSSPSRQAECPDVLRSTSQTQGTTTGLEAAVEQAIAACGGDLRATIRALIVANDYLENEVAELMKAVSHAYARGRFQTYSG